MLIDDGHLDLGIQGDFTPALFHTEHPSEQNGFQQGEDHQGYSTGPIIIFIKNAVFVQEYSG